MSSTTEPNLGQRGQVLVLFAGGVVALLIVAALAFDVGSMLLERRDQQNAADAAALAGARYVLTDEAQAEAAARRVALENGFDDADPDQVVNVFIPPHHGRYVGFPGFIEVQIESERPSIFGGIIGRATWPVGAMAAATNHQDLNFPFSMLALDPTACKAMLFGGNGTVNVYANIQANSSGADCTPPDTWGISRGGTATVNVYADDATCRTVGEIQDSSAAGIMTCDKASGSFALPDPLRNLPAPAQPALAAPLQQVGHTQTIPDYCPGVTTGSKKFSLTQSRACDIGGNGSSYSGLKWLLSPGLYPHGLVVSNNATAYLLPGIYFIGGGGIRTTTGGSIVTVATMADATAGTWGGGVMIYNSTITGQPADSISMGGSAASLLIKPLDVPSTDPNAIYNGIAIFQDRTVTNPITLNGSSSTAEVAGIIYAPAAEVTLNATDATTLSVDQVIANTFKITGNGTINVLRRTGVDSHITAAGLVD